jgi:hypothetical protein
MESVLLVGEDPSLLECRATVLAMMDAKVISCSPTGLSAYLKNEKFDLIVLCNSLSAGSQRLIAASVDRDASGTGILHILRVLPASSEGISGPASAGTTGPAGLHHKVLKILSSSSIDRQNILLPRRLPLSDAN